MQHNAAHVITDHAIACILYLQRMQLLTSASSDACCLINCMHV